MKGLLRILLVLTLLILLGISFFESLAATDCAKNLELAENPCPALLKEKYGRDLTDQETLDLLNYNNQQREIIVDKNKLSEVIIENTLIVPRYRIYGANGISCRFYNFVADDLPPRAMEYVKTHEAFHALGVRSESEANYMAAKLEPIGFIETVGYSILLSVKNTNLQMMPCRIGRLWNIFKVYFLGRQI